MNNKEERKTDKYGKEMPPPKGVTKGNIPSLQDRGRTLDIGNKITQKTDKTSSTDKKQNPDSEPQKRSSSRIKNRNESIGMRIEKPSPYANWGTYFDVEYRANAVWNKLLHKYFDSEDFVICPEAYPGPKATNGKAADLTVNRLVEGDKGYEVDYAYIILEGKGEKGENFDQIHQQVCEWIQAANKNSGPNGDGGNIFKSWVIGVHGKWVRFWFYPGTGGKFKLLPYKVVIQSGGQYTLEGESTDQNFYDITDPRHWPQIEGALQWLSKTDPNDVGNKKSVTKNKKKSQLGFDVKDTNL